MASNPYPLLPIFFAIGTVLPLVPIPFQLQSWNTGIVSYASWCAVLCFFHLLNSIIWHDNVDDVAPVLCDISTYYSSGLGMRFTDYCSGTHIYIGAGVALRSCSLVINRRLYMITRGRSNAIAVTKAEVLCLHCTGTANNKDLVRNRSVAKFSSICHSRSGFLC